MMLPDRARALRKAIPATISELSQAAQMDQQARRYRDHAAEVKAAARELQILAEALAAAARRALLLFDPPPPETHEHYHGPTNPLPPGLLAKATAPAATAGARQE